MKNILFICGLGVLSGFMVVVIRKVVKKCGE